MIRFRWECESFKEKMTIGGYECATTPIIYRVEKRRVVIVIARIGHRREVYR
jgi:mRNA-degrading endonuclease RelE of RelBE toxin-antitoxin system